MDRLEWWNYATKNGTRGDMVLDILEDWKKSDAKTTSLVAQEIISKFNTIYYYGTCVHPAIREDEEVYIIRKQDREAIKSKWGIE